MQKWKGCAAIWPTPTANQFAHNDVPALLARRERAKRKAKNGNGFGLTLANAVAVEMWPTPTVNDSKNATLPPSQVRHDNLPGAKHRAGERSGGRLNPQFVEWLMGYSQDWTRLD